jgi:hypothetical protein
MQGPLPDNTAVRVALWRALHVEVDSPPHVLVDDVGLKLAAPDDGWRSRPDMSPFTRPFRASIERAMAGARANGTPFISFFEPVELLKLAREAGFGNVQHVTAAMLAERYFATRTDGLRPPNNAEELLIATT